MATVMHSRRVQKLGGSSLVVTLPKSWVKRMNIKAGDNIIVIDEGEYLKIMPANMPSNSKSLALKLTHSLSRPDNMKLMVSCSYLHGYDKIVIYNDKIPKTLKGSVKSVKMGGTEKIDDITLRDDMVIIELTRDEDASLPFLLKKLATTINSFIDKLVLGDVDGAKSSLGEVKATVERVVRSASKAEIGFCEPAKTSMALAMMLPLPRLLEGLAEASREVSEEARSEVLERLRRALLELLGGVSSRSTKRVEAAALESIETAKIALEFGGSFAAYTASIAYLLESMAKTAICGLAIEENTL